MWVVIGVGDAFKLGVDAIADPHVSKIWRRGEWPDAGVWASVLVRTCGLAHVCPPSGVKGGVDLICW